MGLIVKVTRASTTEELEKDYVAFARARGLGRRAGHRVVRAAQRADPHRDRAGLIVWDCSPARCWLKSRSGCRDSGRCWSTAVSQRDIPVIQGIVLILAIFVVVLHVLIDVPYAVLDPRIRFGGSRHDRRQSDLVKLEESASAGSVPPAVAPPCRRRARRTDDGRDRGTSSSSRSFVRSSGARSPRTTRTRRTCSGHPRPSASTSREPTSSVATSCRARSSARARRWSDRAGRVGGFTIGTILGLLVGLPRRRIDSVVMRWVDFMFALRACWSRS